MLATSKKKPERVTIPVRGRAQKRTKTIRSEPQVRLRLGVSHRK